MKNGCEGCSDQEKPGVRDDAHPDCGVAVPEGWVVVERCDECELYPDDISAAKALYRKPKYIKCPNGGWHAIAQAFTRRSPDEIVCYKDDMFYPGTEIPRILTDE